MPFDWGPEALLAVLQNFGTFLNILPRSQTVQPATSLALRKIAFNIYVQFNLLMQLNGITTERHDIAISAAYEHLFWHIHRLFNTQQVGSVYDPPT